MVTLTRFFFPISAFYALREYREENVTLYLSSFSCNGTENKLSECSYNFVSFCIGNEEGAVLCTGKRKDQ